MYLTRMKLDATRRNVMKALVAPNIFHGTIENCFDGDKSRKLWRIDSLSGNLYLMLLSEDVPDLKKAYEQLGDDKSEKPWETLPYEKLLNRIENDSSWHFRLVANPTKSVKKLDGKRGTVCAHITEKYQQQWLKEQAAKHGFALADSDFLVTRRQWFRFHKKKGDRHLVSLLCVSYEGKLTVTDVELFKRTLLEGIGRGKAYGMGMMTIVKGV